MTTEPTLDSILSGKATTAAPDNASHVDEPEALIVDPVENKIGTDQVEGQPALDEPDKAKSDGSDNVPDKTGAAFKGQREGLTKRYTEQVAEFQRKLEQADERNARLEQQLGQVMQALAGQRQQPQQPVQQPSVPDVFADPDGYAKHFDRAVQERVSKVALDFDLKLAEVKHGETFGKAWDAFMGSVQTGQNPALYHQVMNAPSPGEAIVDWFKSEQVKREVGADPASYKERLRAEILAELQGTNQPPAVPQPVTNGAAAAPAVMPSNFADARNAGARTGPAWAGPPPLRDIFRK